MQIPPECQIPWSVRRNSGTPAGFPAEYQGESKDLRCTTWGVGCPKCYTASSGAAIQMTIPFLWASSHQIPGIQITQNHEKYHQNENESLVECRCTTYRYRMPSNMTCPTRKTHQPPSAWITAHWNLVKGDYAINMVNDKLCIGQGIWNLSHSNIHLLSYT